eukprot:6948503-Alexandrium_andersonii.AAC.1
MIGCRCSSSKDKRRMRPTSNGGLLFSAMGFRFSTAPKSSSQCICICPLCAWILACRGTELATVR